MLCVGLVQPRKSLKRLLEAWVLMRARRGLVVGGGWGWNCEPIREKMERLGPRGHHLESVDPDELPAIYNMARVVAHPAWYEGFGLPPLEAMASGTPVVVSDRSSLPELVQDAGIIVPAGEPDAWRKALERVVGDTQLAADLRHRGILRAAQFSCERAARLTWRALDEAVRKPAPCSPRRARP